MLRLNDMVFPEGKVIDGMKFRQRVARLASPDWLIDPDCWPIGDLELFRRYIQIQPELGVPSLYFAMSLGGKPSPLMDGDYALIRDVWKSYNETI
jgi:hypothetical protein